jgi:beta-mannanase
MQSIGTVFQKRRGGLPLMFALLLGVALLGRAGDVACASSSRSVYLGVWQPGAPASMSAVTQFERDAGKHVAIVQWYQQWAGGSGAFDPSLPAAVAAHGSMPLITWEPWDPSAGANQPAFALSAIVAGNYDAYVRSWAKGLAAYGKPVLLRFAHEMNGTWYPWARGINGNTPAQYVAAWRHVHDLFAAAGAKNVQWVWSPNVAWDAAAAFTSYFPGDAYVDWLGLDGYNWGGSGWQSFVQVFGASYQSITALSAKPLMIAETASAEAGGSKAQWITDAFSTQIPTKYPRVQAVLWFNQNKENDWRIESSATAQRAFAKAVSSSVYQSSWR